MDVPDQAEREALFAVDRIVETAIFLVNTIVAFATSGWKNLPVPFQTQLSTEMAGHRTHQPKQTFRIISKFEDWLEYP